MTRAQQKQGKQGEKEAERVLSMMGVYNLQKVPTPIGISVRGTGRFAGWVKIFYKEPVLGDRRGELANGISVLVEVKTTSGDKNLVWSAFSGEHQPQGLSNHLGLSLLVWVRDTPRSRDVYVMRWGDVLDAGFRKGHGITQKTAERLKVDELKWESAK